jgi:ubiquitin-protein ligase E3 A
MLTLLTILLPYRYNAILLDLNMPSALFKKLRGETLGLDDLKQLQPDLARGLEALLAHEGEDVEEVFGLTFELTYESYGAMKTHTLKKKEEPSSSSAAAVPKDDAMDTEEEEEQEQEQAVPVTHLNREEYVQLYVSYLLNESVSTQFNAFKKGFDKVMDGHSSTYLRSDELEVLVCGQTDLDFKDLQRGCTYQDGYGEGSPAVALLWRVLHEFGNDDKKTFLRFLTGSDRCPVGGLAAVEMVVSRNTDEEHRLPSAHTCFNHLLLPEYASLEVMREKVRFAMGETEGFGLR